MRKNKTAKREMIFLPKGTRKKKLTNHHLTPKSRKTKDREVIKLFWEKHRAWHELFGDLSLQEIIAVLKRIERQHYN